MAQGCGAGLTQPIGHEPAGATSIDADDLEGLIPAFVATRADLNRVEYENILAALPWARQRARRLGPRGILDASFLFPLHGRMFGAVWTWAGTTRRRQTNIGVPPHRIRTDVGQVFDDARYWHDHDIHSVDRRAALIHYRLVSVHPFPNGNGRCTRLLADLYLESVGAPMFSWGDAGLLDRASHARARYIAALERAPADECASLEAFARG